jgi:hypothetical protein
MATYAQLADLTAYLEDSDVSAPTDIFAGARLIERAEFEVDTLLVGFGQPSDETGLKYNPATDLQPWQAAALARAVCAQAEYRLIMGDEFFAQGQYDSWQGPDFAAKGKLPYFGPKVAYELNGTGIARTAGVSSISTSYLGTEASRRGWLSRIRAN